MKQIQFPKRLGLGLLFGLALVYVFLQACSEQKKLGDARDLGFRNLGDSAQYVGMETCRGCHQEVHGHFSQNGMGQSFGLGNLAKSKASFGPHALVYDSVANFYYFPFVRDSNIWLREFRLNQAGDTIHKLEEAISFIIGSGHHTNSHLVWKNGYLHQAPITYYVQQGKWDLAPGYEGGGNQRFSRRIEAECLTCHNNFPKPVLGSVNKYEEIPLGISCERCHGPGSLHVKDKLAGLRVDTAKGPDYSIVNPRRLPIDLQMDLCQRCHLQGLAVLEPNRSFYDFRPGMRLEEHMQIYLPRFDDSDKHFIMASQADRLRMSACFKTGQLSCLSCHHPHYQVKDTLKNPYNAVCRNCHQGKAGQMDCKLSLASRGLKANNCVACHMPKTSSIDIPHVHISEHWLSRQTALDEAGRSRVLKQEEVGAVRQFLGLEALTQGGERPERKALAYLDLYDKFFQQPLVLDSAVFYLKQLGKSDWAAKLWLRYYYTLGQDRLAVEAVAGLDLGQLEAEQAYRLGHAWVRLGDWAKGRGGLERAVQLEPYRTEFREQLAICLAALGEAKAARRHFEFILNEGQAKASVFSNYGLFLAQQGEFDAALRQYDQALKLDPDYRPAQTNRQTLKQALGLN